MCFECQTSMGINLTPKGHLRDIGVMTSNSDDLFCSKPIGNYKGYDTKHCHTHAEAVQQSHSKRYCCRSSTHSTGVYQTLQEQ